MDANEQCDCTEEYGPCEQHGTVLVQREGASLRTADELAQQFLLDARDIDPEILAPYGADVLARVSAALSAERWLPAEDDGALADELYSVVDQVESNLDAWTVRDDGYRIVRPSADCPLLDS